MGLFGNFRKCNRRGDGATGVSRRRAVTTPVLPGIQKQNGTDRECEVGAILQDRLQGTTLPASTTFFCRYGTPCSNHFGAGAPFR